jgi:hypothetical protein
MEKMPDRVEIKPNLEPNDSELLFSRLENCQIREQFFTLALVYYRAMYESSRSLKEEMPQDKFLAWVREMFEKQLEKAKSKTDIDLFDQVKPHHYAREVIIPLSDKKTPKQQSISEAHEKGHHIRSWLVNGEFFPFSERIYDEYFAKGFDWEKLEYGRDTYQKDVEQFEREYQSSREHSGPPDTSYENFRRLRIDYLSSSQEIIERMSQLKCYFGMSENEIFSKEHLNYTREHYVLDTGKDNNMIEFLSAITPETEEAFLWLINSSGI